MYVKLSVAQQGLYFEADDERERVSKTCTRDLSQKQFDGILYLGGEGAFFRQRSSLWKLCSCVLHTIQLPLYRLKLWRGGGRGNVAWRLMSTFPYCPETRALWSIEHCYMI